MPHPSQPGKVRIRRLKATQIDRLYEKLLHPTDDVRPLAPKSVMEVHQIIRPEHGVEVVYDDK